MWVLSVQTEVDLRGGAGPFKEFDCRATNVDISHGDGGVA